ncbi:AT DNA binding protein [Aspergillus sclerotialis]|uniref:AT DNA binding protein n=1 Tax=Aspergillus sclerotialis TaxID=2070753 RepID=A0A3A2ZZJ0_9EURO|nr:AT DNA binding protein [Aspergillus sclerotialis]
MSSRESSSSPDVLGPPGDADYLISSPFKPFAGRQSFMSPANFRPLQTPHKRQRISLSPAKTAHSIKFDDVLLPASPTMKLNGDPRSPSPDKVEQDGNVSPWRIRVTLEATQDENNQGSPRRKRLTSPTKTTKVPLKDEQDQTVQTPGRRRGRPRKSALRERDATPIPGSPGHTPGPQGTGQKRKRGRPRKSMPDSDLPKDIHTNDEAPVVEPERSWSPLNIAADADSDDGLPDDQVANSIELDNQIAQPDAVTWDRGTPRVTFEPQYDTPDVGAIDQDYMGDDAYLHSTPSKMPSPTRESQIASPENASLHAGHTPGPNRQRTYPTPTSSSQVDDERQGQERHPEGSKNESQHGVYHPTDDPTDDHREFDSIMESEGFSMVSLDTLPSAKQHGLNTNSKLTKGPLKPFLKRESIGITDRIKRKSPLPHGNHHEHSSPAKEHSSPEHLYPTLPVQSPGTTMAQDNATVQDHKPDRTSPAHLYPKLPSNSPSRNVSTDYPRANGHATALDASEPSILPVLRKRPFLRLARILRVGIALEGTLRHHGISTEPDIETCRRNLETIFSNFHPEIQRDLRAGLVLAKELAKRLSWIETIKRRVAARKNNSENVHEGRTPQQPQGRESIKDSPNSEMKRRMAEWQREREAVSREIEMANSSQVIVLDSDTQSPHSQEDDYANGENDGKEPQFDQGFEQPEYGDSDVKPEQEPEEPEQNMSNDDEDYEDIWQQEARDQSHVSHRSSMNRHSDERQQPSRHISSSRKSSPVTSPSENVESSSPVHWAKDNNDLVPNLGHSRIKQLREQKVDLSPLFRAEYTPRRYQYYYGKSSPQSAAKQSTQQQQPPIEHDWRVRQPDEHSKSIPVNNDVAQQQDVTRHQSYELHSDQEMGEDEDQDLSDNGSAEERSVHEHLDVTPRPSKKANGDIQGSSWFQRLTSLTPGWLKAPKAEPKEEQIPENEEAFSPVSGKETSADLQDPLEDMDKAPESPRMKERPQEQQNSIDIDSSEHIEAADFRIDNYQKRARPRPLALSGYFTDEHYAALRRLYRLAKRYPEYFPYYPRPGHSDIIGDWIWTSDGAYGVPVTEGQFAVVDRFAQELADASLEDGGPGQIDWTEAELHRRLISIIIGEQVREERKAKALPDDTRRSESRETSVDIWRP